MTTYLSDLQDWVNVVQVHNKLIFLHVIHHSRTANVVKRFLWVKIKINTRKHLKDKQQILIYISWVCQSKSRCSSWTNPVEESVEDGSVELIVLSDVSQSVGSRQKSDEPRGGALRSRSHIKEKWPAVDLQTWQDTRDNNTKKQVYFLNNSNNTRLQTFNKLDRN